MTFTLSEDQQAAVIALNKAVETKGEDYIYERGSDGTCQYNTYDASMKPTGPSCIVGFVCWETELVDPSALYDYEGSSAAHVLPWGNDDPVTEALTRAQAAQDDGQTWGESRDKALYFLREAEVDLSFLA